MSMGFVAALGIARRGLDAWASKPHNRQWWRRIEGTPIPNDLTVHIANEFAEHSGGREWPDGRLGADDDGELSVAIALDRGRVVVRFDHPTEWIGFDAESLGGFIRALEGKLAQLQDGRAEQ